MDLREIAAEKIRAMNDRIRYRDFYDFAMICLKLNIQLKEVIELVKKKEIRKTISPNNILRNWEIANKDKLSEISAIHFTEELNSDQIESQIKQLKFKEILK